MKYLIPISFVSFTAIFVMLLSAFITLQTGPTGLFLELPEARYSRTAIPQRRISIALINEGSILINRVKRINSEDIRQEIISYIDDSYLEIDSTGEKRLRSDADQPFFISLSIDPHCSYEKIQPILNVMREIGLTQGSFTFVRPD